MSKALLPDEPWRAGPRTSAAYLRGEGTTFALSQATHALTLVVALLARRLGRRPVVWVSAYFCDNGLGPVRAGAELHLYPVTAGMAPDWPATEAMLAGGAPDLFILPHLFGVENEAEQARAFADTAGALLLEDAAHVLVPVGQIGRHGDFVTYSPRKFAPIPDGGILVVRGRGLAAEMEAVAAGFARYRPAVAPYVAGRLLGRLRPARTSPMHAVAIDREPPAIDTLPGVLMSRFSRARLEQAAEAGFDSVARREGAVASRLEQRLDGFGGLGPLPRHRDSTPYLLALRGRSEPETAETFRRLRAAGANVATWPGLPPEVWAAPERYGAALDIRRTLLRFTPRPSARRRPLDFLERL